MIEINQDLVNTYYESLCEKSWTGKQIRNYLHYRKKHGMKIEWLSFKCAYAMWQINHEGQDENC